MDKDFICHGQTLISYAPKLCKFRILLIEEKENETSANNS